MAVYKSTFCSPYNKSFDMGEFVDSGDVAMFTGGDLPISVECVADTSNTTVTGYSIDIYDEDGKSVFPIKEFTGVGWWYHDGETEISIGFCPAIPELLDLYDNNGFIERVYVDSENAEISNGMVNVTIEGRVEPTKVIVEYAKEDRVTMISDLVSYLSANAAFYNVPNDDGVNSGVNGTRMFVPIAPNPRDYGVWTGNTISKNLIFYHPAYNPDPESEENTPVRYDDILNTNRVQNGHSYSWTITLYQGVSKNSDGDIVFPNDKREYDIPITNGQVMGSNDYRIQTAPIEEKISLLDKYIQPVIIPDLSYDPSHPLKWTKGSGDIQQYTKRTIIENYDSTYGYIYPYGYRRSQTSTDVINKNNNVNGYRIYKNGNDVENLTAADKVRVVWDGSIVDGIGGWEWEESAVSPSKSHWKSYYLSATKPDSAYTPFTNSVSYGPTVYDGDRILLNHTMQSINRIKYSGSPLNGVYAPSFSIEEVKAGDVVKEVVPVEYYEPGGESSISYYIAHPTIKPSSVIAHTPSARVFSQENGVITEHNNVSCSVENATVIRVDATGIDENCVCEIEYTVASSISGTPYKVSADWYRTPDADSWGELSVKTLLVTDGSYTNGFYGQTAPGTIGVNENCEIPQVISGGSLNSTPFMFVPERPIRLYRSAANLLVGRMFSFSSYLNDYWAVRVYRERVGDAEIGTIDRVEFKMTADDNYEILSATDYIYTPGDDAVLIKKSAIASFPHEIDVYFTPDDERDYTGLIFYNKFSVSDGNILYIRPFSGIEADMVYKESANVFSPRWFKIEEVDTNYWFVRYNTAQLSLGMFETGDRYTINSFYRRGDYSPFGLYKNPDFSIKVRGDGRTMDYEYDSEDEAYEVPDYFPTVYCNDYDQEDYISWKSYQFIVTDSVGNSVVYEEKYSGDISQRIEINDDDIEGGKYYDVKLVIKTNKNAIITKEIRVHCVTNIQPGASVIYERSVSFDMENSCVKISLKPSIQRVSLIIRRAEIGTRQAPGYSEHMKTDYKYLTKAELYSGQETIIEDYSVLNGRTYVYSFLVCAGEDGQQYSERFDIPIKVCSPGWTILSAKKTKDGAYEASSKDVWRFRYNASGGEHTVNMSRSQQDTLGRFQRIYTGKQNYVSGQVSSLIGREFIPTYLANSWYAEVDERGYAWREDEKKQRQAGGYTESLARFSNGRYIKPEALGFRDLTSNEAVDMINKFNEFCASSDPKILKNEKGEGFLVQIINHSYTNEDNMINIPTTVNFGWVQIGKLDDIRIVSTRVVTAN